MNCIFPITKTPFHSGQMAFLTLGEDIADFQFGFVLLFHAQVFGQKQFNSTNYAEICANVNRDTET